MLFYDYTLFRLSPYILLGPHVRWPLVTTEDVEGEDSLQLWRVAVNKLNKQLRTADKEWASSLEVGHGVGLPNVRY
jgi:hypothetical protein